MPVERLELRRVVTRGEPVPPAQVQLVPIPPLSVPESRYDDAHAHTHAHGHSHAHGHAHSHDWSHLAMSDGSVRMLRWALCVQFAFLVCEFIGGLITNSLALLGDAAHMLADVGALGLALLAANLAARPVSSQRTWGFVRAEVVAAVANATTLILSCGWIAFESIRRWFSPEDVHAPGLIAVAVAGLVANLVGAGLLARADRGNVNIRAAMAHTLVDAASSIGVILAGIVIAVGGPVLVDTIASLLIAVVAVRATLPVLRTALDALMDAAPAGVDADAVAAALTSVEGVVGVHDVHVWEPGPRRIALTAHVLVLPGVDVGAAIVDLGSLLRSRFGVDHATLQIAPDRRFEHLDIERLLPRDVAVERAVQLATRSRPGCNAAMVWDAVSRRVTHLAPEQRASPVRLAASALRDFA